MPSLIPTEHYGVITWLGVLPDRAVGLQTVSCPQIYATFAGFEGEDHGGLTRASCSRVTLQYPKGTTIRNTRQLCVMSAEELTEIAKEMGVETLDPSYAGASMVIEGIPDFTHVPPSSRLQGASGATITVDMLNRPCHLPAQGIDADMPGFGKAFKGAAKDRRGVTAWVEREGSFAVGDKVRLHVPDQRAWQVG